MAVSRLLPTLVVTWRAVPGRVQGTGRSAVSRCALQGGTLGLLVEY